MTKQTTKITTFYFEDEDLIEEFNNYLRSIKKTEGEKKGLKYIFNTCILDKKLFVGLKGKNIKNEKDYIHKWVDKYFKAYENDIFKREAPKSKTLSDPVIDVIIEKTVNKKELKKLKDGHKLYMQAEQLQGAILEAFIAQEVENYGWYYCCGEIVKSVDFCSEKGELLQIKNKYNTENSSSKSVRENTSIKKWSRIGRPKKGKNTYNWGELCDIINQNKKKDQQDLNINEDDYVKFVKKVIKKNPKLLYIDDMMNK